MTVLDTCYFSSVTLCESFFCKNITSLIGGYNLTDAGMIGGIVKRQLQPLKADLEYIKKQVDTIKIRVDGLNAQLDKIEEAMKKVKVA
jgi:hypothetical protein